MIVRILLVFAAIAAVSALAAWLSDHPGAVAMVWQGYRVDTSVGILLAAVAVVAVAVALLYRFWRGLFTLGRGARRMRGERRTREGYLALSRGLVAVAAGDADEARRQARRANALLDEPALTRLLAAQAAQLDGDEAAARRYFTGLLEARETEFLGVRGLLTLAEQEGDDGRALELARRAEALRPEVPWVPEKLFALEVEAGNWAAAEATVREAVRRKLLAPEAGQARRAAVLLEQSRLAEAKGDTPAAIRHARKALGETPALTAAAIRLAALLHAEDEPRRARKVIEDAYAQAPHPELARLHALVSPSDDPIKRLKTLERLEKLAPDDTVTHLVMAKASLDARLWGETRRHLKAATDGPPTAAVCRLMAAVEEAEHGDTPSARAWYARAAEAEPDPGWVCGDCGAVADDWSAVCANCGAFGELSWTAPPRVTALLPTDAEAAAEGALQAVRREPAPAAIVQVPPPTAGDPAVPDPGSEQD